MFGLQAAQELMAEHPYGTGSATLTYRTSGLVGTKAPPRGARSSVEEKKATRMPKCRLAPSARASCERERRSGRRSSTRSPPSERARMARSASVPPPTPCPSSSAALRSREPGVKTAA
jgi:hypothetical protein